MTGLLERGTLPTHHPGALQIDQASNQRSSTQTFHSADSAPERHRSLSGSFSASTNLRDLRQAQISVSARWRSRETGGVHPAHRSLPEVSARNLAFLPSAPVMSPAASSGSIPAQDLVPQTFAVQVDVHAINQDQVGRPRDVVVDDVAAQPQPQVAVNHDVAERDHVYDNAAPEDHAAVEPMDVVEDGASVQHGAANSSAELRDDEGVVVAAAAPNDYIVDIQSEPDGAEAGQDEAEAAEAGQDEAEAAEAGQDEPEAAEAGQDEPEAAEAGQDEREAAEAAEAAAAGQDAAKAGQDEPDAAAEAEPSKTKPPEDDGGSGAAEAGGQPDGSGAAQPSTGQSSGAGQPQGSGSSTGQAGASAAGGPPAGGSGASGAGQPGGSGGSGAGQPPRGSGQPDRQAEPDAETTSDEDDKTPSAPKKRRVVKRRKYRKRKSPYVMSEDSNSSPDDDDHQFPTRFSPRNKRGYRY